MLSTLGARSFMLLRHACGIVCRLSPRNIQSLCNFERKLKTHFLRAGQNLFLIYLFIYLFILLINSYSIVLIVPLYCLDKVFK